MSDYPLKTHHLTANTIRGLAMDAVQKAHSGHPGMPMGMADVAVVLWSQFLKHNPKDPKWPDRDRFVLSAGHGSMLLYSLLHLSGYDLPMEQLQQFRQWGSLTPGHPESHLTPGVETTTGPLGQGITNAVGMALAERWLATRYNRPGHEIINHYTYVIASDGDLMEGISHEACSLAGHLGLGKLIVFYDDNGITIDGPTELTFTEDVLQRFAAYGWHTQRIDGHDPLAILAATEAAQAVTDRPSLIACRTHIGFGSPNKQDTSKAHGEPLGEDEIRLTKERLGWPLEPKFYVPDEARAFLAAKGKEGAEKQAVWETMFHSYREAYAEVAAELELALRGELPAGWDDELPQFEPGSSLATRASSGQVLNAIARRVPYLLGGSADLTGSNKTDVKGEKAISRADFSGRYIHYGVREHGMGGIMNGMALHGGIRPYGGTFLVFSDYMRGSVRLSALMGLPVVYVFTHDSIGLGEDGPTHQPVEQLMSLRMIPHLTVIRPADATETAVAWQVAMTHKHGPVALVLTRQGVPTLDRNQYAPADGVARGAYIISDMPNPQVILIGTGSELHLALAAQSLLADKGVAARVVSMPSWELFDAQPEAYRHEVLPPHIEARVSIEAGVTLGWERYVGAKGKAIGLDRFGASAPYKIIYEKLGITAEVMADTALGLLG
ncbi:MAG: transketolase [Chloroflexi bacterium]|nr:MAG: transketolase [Chloroflexota bacterium]